MPHKINAFIDAFYNFVIPYLIMFSKFVGLGTIGVSAFVSLSFFILITGFFSFRALSIVGLSDSLISDYLKKNDLKRTHGTIYRIDNPTRKYIIVRNFFWFCGVVNSVLAVLVSLILILGFFAYYILNREFFDYFLIEENGFLYIVSAILLGFAFAWLFYDFYLRLKIADYGKKVNQSILNSRKRVNADKGVISDIREIKFNDRINFDPVSYFSKAKKLNSVFLGVNDNNEPIYIKRDKWKKTNVQIMGEAGSGKGVLACSALAQCGVNYNDCNIIFDPKNDEWACHVLKEHSKRFILVDLRQGKNAQLNLFKDLSSYQLEELFISGFDLGRKGRDSDHFRVGEREAIKMLTKMFPNGTNARELMLKINELPKEVKNESRDILIQLRELCSLSVLQTDQGVDLKDFIQNGGTLYFRGHMRDESIIILQKIIFLRCIQLIEERDREEETTHVNIFLDEFKYLLSKISLNSLGTVRDKNCNILISHQSLGDFGDCGDLSEKSVSTMIIDNTPIKWIYRMSDLKAAEWASGYTGDMQVDSERRNISTADGNVEHESIHITKFKESRKLVDTNMMQNLPDGCALFIGNGTAVLSYSNYIKAKKGNIPLEKFEEFEPLPFEAMAYGFTKEKSEPRKNNSYVQYSTKNVSDSNETKDFKQGNDEDDW